MSRYVVTICDQVDTQEFYGWPIDYFDTFIFFALNVGKLLRYKYLTVRLLWGC